MKGYTQYDYRSISEALHYRFCIFELYLWWL